MTDEEKNFRQQIVEDIKDTLDFRWNEIVGYHDKDCYRIHPACALTYAFSIIDPYRTYPPQ